MKRFVLIGFFSVVLALGLLVGMALAANPQQKGFLFLGAKPSCSLSHFAQEGTVSSSTFRLVLRVKTGQLVGRVVLRGATPFTSYGVRLIQGGSDCHTDDGTLTTNRRGKGRATIREAASSSKAVLMVCPSSGDCFTSKPVFTH